MCSDIIGIYVEFEFCINFMFGDVMYYYVLFNE